MKKFFTTALALVTTIALGQAAVAPQAAEILEKAKVAHGATALDGLKTYEETLDITYFDEKANPALKLRGVQRTDLVNDRMRLELYQGETLALIQQYDPKGSSAWNPQSGTVKLPKAEAESLRKGFYQGVLGLRFGKNREAANVAAGQKWLELQGDAVSVTTKGVKTEYLVAANGVIIAERTEAAQIGSLIVAYSDVRDISGVKTPFSTKAYAEAAKNLLVYETQTTEVKINPALTAKDFELPKQ